MSLDNIIKRILEDANTKAGELINDAEAKAKDMIAKAEAEAHARAEEILDNARLQSDEETKRSFVTKNLEVKKEISKEKLSLIDEAFRSSCDQLLALDNAKYLDILEKALVRLREKEGKVLFSKKDSGRANAHFVDKVNKTYGLRLEFGGYCESTDGGFILEKDRMNIDMRFSTLLKDLREKYLFEVSKILFV